MKINRIKKLNCLNFDMFHLMLEKLKTIQTNSETMPNVVLMSGMGGRAFCSGGDVVSLYKAGVDGSNTNFAFDFF